jgi:hypothetical protein
VSYPLVVSTIWALVVYSFRLDLSAAILGGLTLGVFAAWLETREIDDDPDY